MADLSDVTAYLATVAADAVYPNGFGNPSIAPAADGYTQPMDVRIYEGWPQSEQLDLDVGGKILSGNPPVPAPRPDGPCINVSVYPLNQSRDPYQIQDQTYVLKPVVLGLSIGISAGTLNVSAGTNLDSTTNPPATITASGSPNPGEFITIVADRANIFSASGGTTAAIFSSLLSQAQSIYPGATGGASSLTLPYDFACVVRQGGQATMGKVIHRQCHRVMVSVWAPDHGSRSVIASAIDVAIKENIIVSLPDSSDMKVLYDGTRVTDETQNMTVYRRDLIYDCEYATLQTFPGYTITSVTIDVASGEFGDPPPPFPAQINAIT